MEFHELCSVLKKSTHCIDTLDADVRSWLDTLLHEEVLKNLIGMYELSSRHFTSAQSGSVTLRAYIETYYVDHMVDSGTGCQSLGHTQAFTHNAQHTVEAMLEIWKDRKTESHRLLGLEVCHRLSDVSARCASLAVIPLLLVSFVDEFMSILRSAEENLDLACMKLTKLLASFTHSDTIGNLSTILYEMLDKREDSVLQYALNNLKTWEWFEWLLNLFALFVVRVMNGKMYDGKSLRKAHAS
jgi:hypothetical protein